MNFQVTGSKKPFATAYTVGSESFFPRAGVCKKAMDFFSSPIYSKHIYIFNKWLRLCMNTTINIFPAKSNKQRKEFRRFVCDLYTGDVGWVASNLFLLDIFLYQKDSFCKQAFVTPLLIQLQGSTVAQCILVNHPNMPQIMQVAFFEALPNQEHAVQLLLEYAEQQAKELSCTEILIGLNGHLAYGVGIMQSGWGRPTSLDSLYHKPYYQHYFDDPIWQKHTLSTYRFDPVAIHNKYHRFSQLTNQYTYRQFNIKYWKQEMILFGTLANNCLNHTRYYFDRPPVQLLELMNTMKFLMKPEYLLFVLHHGKEVGFIFWHPDFNEVLTPGKQYSSIYFALQAILKKLTIKTVKVNAIGLLPAYWNTPAAMGLFLTALQYSKMKYPKGETNFIWDCNVASRKFITKMGGQVDRTYAVYSKPVGTHAY
jgi:hypothetical protein